MSNLPVPANYPWDPTPADQDIESFPRAITALDKAAEKIDVAATFGKSVGFVLRPADPLKGVFKVAVDRIEAQIQLLTTGTSPRVELIAIFYLPFGTPAVVNGVSGYVTDSSSLIMEFSSTSTPIMGGGSMRVEKKAGQIFYSISITIAGIAYTANNILIL